MIQHDREVRRRLRIRGRRTAHAGTVGNDDPQAELFSGTNTMALFAGHGSAARLTTNGIVMCRPAASVICSGGRLRGDIFISLPACPGVDSLL